MFSPLVGIRLTAYDILRLRRTHPRDCQVLITRTFISSVTRPTKVETIMRFTKIRERSDIRSRTQKTQWKFLTNCFSLSDGQKYRWYVLELDSLILLFAGKSLEDRSAEHLMCRCISVYLDIDACSILSSDPVRIRVINLIVEFGCLCGNRREFLFRSKH